MENGIWKFLVVFMVAAMFSVAFAAEQQTTTQQPAASASSNSGLENFRDWFHNPTDWLNMGADIRWRYVYAPNIDTLNDNARSRDSVWNFTRNRFRYWVKTKLSEDVDFNIKWTWEFRTWDEPARKDKNHDFDEIYWDIFNLTVRNLGDMPLTMVVGRQEIILGKGWLVLDGTPLDGSRTISMDALRFTYKIPDRDTTLDLIYVENRAASDAWLKPINDRDRHITEQDERGVIVYLTDKSRPNMQLEGYFIYKNDNPIDTPVRDEPESWPGYWSKKAEIYTLGGAVSGAIAQSEHWKYRVEGAVQAGKKQTQEEGTAMHNLRAFGTVDRIEYHFNDAKKNVLHGTFEFLSGDDSDNGKNTAFDPLWGEWPQWSELYVYCYNLETMIGETTNLYRFNIGHSVQLTDKVTMDTDYHLLWADKNTEKNRPHAGVIEFSDSDKFRGQLVTWWLKYSLTKNLKGHFLFEYFMPGNYYAEASRDNAYFARVNLEYTF